MYRRQNEKGYMHSYSGRNNEAIPVQSDQDPVDDPVNPAMADSDNVLNGTERDDRKAVEKSNVARDRSRSATKPGGTYFESGDEEELPGPGTGLAPLGEIGRCR
ncbi:hypothetical protein DL765_006978 [Monosporascus sp. GIB2]|nr:hypothetical protein DL765_006978 [Monosporascus sp. GIB2]